MDGETLGILEDLGYWIDCSVTPAACFAEAGAPDFLGAPAHPYHPDFRDVRRPGGSRTSRSRSTWTSCRRSGMRLISGPWGSLAASALNRLGLVTWFRPSYAREAAMKRLVRRWEALRHPVLNMMFHSSELLPGASPYTPGRAAVGSLLGRLAGVLLFAIRRGWKPCRMSGLPDRLA